MYLMTVRVYERKEIARKGSFPRTKMLIFVKLNENNEKGVVIRCSCAPENAFRFDRRPDTVAETLPVLAEKVENFRVERQYNAK